MLSFKVTFHCTTNEIGVKAAMFKRGVSSAPFPFRCPFQLHCKLVSSGISSQSAQNILLYILLKTRDLSLSYHFWCSVKWHLNQASGFNICFYLCNSRVSNGFRRKPNLVFCFMFITDFYETKVPLLQTVLERIFVTSKF